MGSFQQAESTIIKTLTVDDIPNCSVTDQVILELITDDEVDLEQLAGMIEENPSLAALIIGLANSAFFSAPSVIYNVQDAIIKVLGMRMVRSIVLSVILGRSLDLSRCPAFSVEDYWADCLTVARGCQLLTYNSDFKTLVTVDQVYLAGLLAGFGHLVLIHHYPEEMNEIIEVSESKLDLMLQAQQDLLGMDQAEAGVLLGKRWVLPDIVVDTMHHSLDVDYRGNHWEISALVGDVSRLVNSISREEEVELCLGEVVEGVLNMSSAECDLAAIKNLRADFSALAKHLKA